jgi:hypothetical protein
VEAHAFSGLGLVLGTMAPDLAAILVLHNDSVLAHTFAGQLYITVPMVLALHGCATGFVFPWLLVALAERGRSVLLVRALTSRPARSAAEWVRVGYSGLLGGLTHFWLDGFTHGNHVGWAREFLPVLSSPVDLTVGVMPLHDVLQWSLTLVLGIAALRMLRGLADPVPSSTPGPRGGTAAARGSSGLLRGCVLCALAGAASAVLMRPDADFALRAELAVYGALAGPLYGAFIAALVHRLREVWTQRPVAVVLGGDGAPWAA